MSVNKIRVKHNPNGRYHPYTATMVGQGPYGWGNTAAEARAKLIDNLAAAKIEAESTVAAMVARAEAIIKAHSELQTKGTENEH